MIALNGDITSTILQIINAIRTLGDGIANLIVWGFTAFGIQIPTYAVQIVMTVLLVFMLFKIGSSVSKILIFVVIIIMVVSGAGNIINLPFNLSS